jgi:phage tail sheath gpL-like
MSTLDSSSLAAANAVGIRNEVINPGVTILGRKIVIIGVADAAKLSGGLAVDTPVRVYSAPEVGSIVGYGTMLHRLAEASYLTSSGAETWIIPQAEGGTDVLATGTITIVAATAKTGTLSLYINGQNASVSVANDASETDIADAIVAKITGDTKMPVTAENTAGVITITSISKGVWGNDLSIALNLEANQVTPEGVTVTIVDMASGSGVADIAPALAAMGTGDNSNEKHFTALVHGYGQDATTLDAISTYNGEGNTNAACYDKLVGRFFRSVIGNVENDLSALITFSDSRKLDRTNGVVVVPNSPNHPSEIGALAIGGMEAANAILAKASYIGFNLPGVFPGLTRWTDEYDNRDTAVKAGISPTMVIGGNSVVLQNVVSFYRPDSVPQENNGFRSMRDISISQNIAYNNRRHFGTEQWQNITIVEVANTVTDPTAKRQVRDIQSVKDAIVFLAGKYLGLGMLFSLTATLDGLKEVDSVRYRQGGTGFDFDMKVVYSGEGGILNQEVIFDINFGV